MARHERPPEGFAIAELPDGRYYPLEVNYFYSARSPDGMLTIDPLAACKGDDVQSFARYNEALAFCQERAAIAAWLEQERFEHLVAASECYPERCAWYCDLIGEVTGESPEIKRWYQEVWVTTPGYFCSMCGRYHKSGSTIKALTIEEALSTAAEAVYARYTRCCARATVAPGVCLEGERHAS